MFFLHVSTYFLQDSTSQCILVCVVMVQGSYIPRCRVMFDLHNLGARLCKLACNLYLFTVMNYHKPSPL